MSGPPPRGANGMGPLPAWADLVPAVPQIVATMRRYLTQISCVLRLGSVSGADLALRSFAAFLPQAVHDTRDQELTWAQIGELLGTTTAATAARRDHIALEQAGDGRDAQEVRSGLP